jgi:hypothetical protein
MNMDLLKQACVTECREAFEAFKHAMHNSPFLEPINQGYIDDSIQTMIQKIGVPKKVINASSELSAVQLAIMNREIDYHEQITIKVARKYGAKFLH